MNENPIVIIEDDPNDVDIIVAAHDLLNIPNKLKVFKDSFGVLNYLTEPSVQPLLVVSDVNLPKVDGISLYQNLLTIPDFVAKRIPYVFFSTAPNRTSIGARISGCGYFVKPQNYFDYVELVQRILLYWLKASESGRSYA